MKIFDCIYVFYKEYNGINILVEMKFIRKGFYWNIGGLNF